MKERPIIFSAEMVRAILDGRKTQTRRVWKYPFAEGRIVATGCHERPWAITRDAGKSGSAPKCPYGVPGDRLFPAMEVPSLGRMYCADVFGAIWSRARNGKTWRRLRGSPTSKGYLCITPAIDGKYKTRLVHRLVAEAFYGYEPNGLRQVRHLDGDQLNNAPINLDWGTQQDNWSDRLVHGNGCGEAHHSAKLTKQQANEIRASSAPQRWLSTRYGVTQSVVWGIKSGCIWCEDPHANPPNMPRWASRITLEVVSVRVERVQDISEADARAEGFRRNGRGSGQMLGVRITAKDHFAQLWDPIYAKRGFGWDVNPWVWAVEFRRVTR